MPILQSCSAPGCPRFKGRCPDHDNRQRDNKTDEERKFYRSYAWRKRSERHRRDEPLCRTCKAKDLFVPATVTDHILAIRDGGDPWDEENLQSQCDTCHQEKRAAERRARVGGVGKRL